MINADPYERLWQSRADAFLAALMPIIDWARDSGRRWTSQALAETVSLHGLGEVADYQRLLVQPEAATLPLPAELTRSLRQYLCDMAGFDPARPCSEQPAVVSEQHGYVLFAARDRLRALVA